MSRPAAKTWRKAASENDTTLPSSPAFGATRAIAGTPDESVNVRCADASVPSFTTQSWYVPGGRPGSRAQVTDAAPWVVASACSG